MRLSATMGVLLSAVPAGGCARRAPGPEECHAFALALTDAEVGAVGRSIDRRRPLRVAPGLRAALEERILAHTTKCLTTPYDRELVGCVTGGGSARVCIAEFQARRGPAPGDPRGLP